MDTRPVPAFYCCYLLRSTVRPASLYIGSTPDPRRRLAQHNGTSKGGAVRTSRANCRPWEMACIVHGFPSSLAALQFEWAWQHPHLSKKIPDDQRLVTKSKRAPVSLTGRLSSLHLLLRVPAFARWPLTLRFFSGEVHQAWTKHCEKTSPLPVGLKVLLDPRIAESDEEDTEVALSPDEDGLPPSSQISVTKKRKSKWAATGQGGVQGLDITNDQLEIYVRKTTAVLDEIRASGAEVKCQICRGESVDDQTVVCLHAFCDHTAHLTCLAEAFLKQEETKSGGDEIHVLPVLGECPDCAKTSHWGDIVKTLSLRTRVKEKASRGKATVKPKAVTAKTGRGRKRQATPLSEMEGSDEEMEPEVSAMDIADDIPEEEKAELSMLDLAESSSEGESWLLQSQQEVKTTAVGRKKKSTTKSVEKPPKKAPSTRKKPLTKVLELEEEE